MIDLNLITGTGVKDFLAALVEPLQTNGDLMLTSETELKKRAKFNGQKIVLQAALNDIFGISIAPFILVDNSSADGIANYFFNESEITPQYFYNDAELTPFYFINSAEVTMTYDFKVLIPASIYTAALERQIRAEVDLYKLAGTRYITETYV